MASPQLEDGYCMLALELLAAIASADFPKLEKMILAYVVAGQYGPQKLSSVVVDPIGLAGLVLGHPSNFRRALKNLVAGGALVERTDGTYSIAKDWSSWTTRGNPRVDPEDARFVANVVTTFGVRDRSTKKQKSQSNETRKTSVSESIQTQKESNETHKRAFLGSIRTPINSDASDVAPATITDLQIPSSHEAVPPDPLREEETREETIHTDGSSKVLPCPGAPADAPASVPGGEGSIDELAKGARSFIRKATISGSYPKGNPDFADFAEQQCRSWCRQGYPAAIVKEFVKKAVAEGAVRSPTNWSNFVQGCLNIYAEKQARLAVAPPVAVASGQASPRPSKADRNSEVFAARRASMAKLFPGKENPDGSR